MLAYLSPERRQEADDASPERLLVLFYDQVIDHLHTAVNAIARNDIQERCNALTAATELLGEMLLCFDLDSGDPIVDNLREIHTFVIGRLPQVNIFNDAKFVAECVRLLKPLRDAWWVTDKVANQTVHRSKAPHPATLPPAVKGRPKLTLVAPLS